LPIRKVVRRLLGQEEQQEHDWVGRLGATAAALSVALVTVGVQLALMLWIA
jgi:hypothetical protein